ncbi:MAG: fumarylacetoacetate hydrolase family protein [Cyanobacteria bacterium P01_A01_bin.105]
MAQRYVRVQSNSGPLHYGLLQADRSVQTLDAAPWLGGELTDQVLMADAYQLLAPCAPSKIVGVGRNYAAHAAETESPQPVEPLLFLKPTTTVIPTAAAVVYPPMTQRVDYEGELALVIGERCFACTSDVARGKIWGYTIANDVTARDLQRQDVQWVRAKGCDSFCPLGPWLVRELPPDAQLQTFLNDQPEPVQSAPVSDMLFSPAEIVAYISQAMTLLPGDVVLTGTPAGVGPVQLGDRIRIEIEGIGALENTVVSRQTETHATPC